jgi:predicted phage terminase large subunit-like protein
VLTCDPAISEKVSACRSAITVVGMSPAKLIFVLDYWVGRQGDPAKLIHQMLQMAYEWQPRVIGIESVAFQASMEPYTIREMQMRGVHYPLLMLKPDRNERKQQRILSMQPFFRAGQVYIQRGMFELIEEFETFPLGATQDMLDALAYAFRLLAPQEQERPSILKDKLNVLAKQDPSSARYWRALHRRDGKLDDEMSIDDILDGAMDGTEERFEVGVGDLL